MTTAPFPTCKREPFGADLIDRRLESALPPMEQEPQHLHRAMRHAVLSPGKRFRPRLLLAVAASCCVSGEERELAMLAAGAVELIHCACLVHDDLPCFDDVPIRRGEPSVHARWGEATAILVGNALIARALSMMAEAPDRLAPRAVSILRLMGRAVGTVEGVIGGLGLEAIVSDPGSGTIGDGGGLVCPELVDRYHAMRTAAMFRLAAGAGAASAGVSEPQVWGELGLALGLVYQLADGLGVGQEGGRASLPQVAMKSASSARDEWLALVQRARRLATSLAPDPGPISTYIDELAALARVPGHG